MLNTDAVTEMQEEDKAVRETLMKLFEMEDNEKKDAGFKSAATMAIDAAVAVFNVFRSLQGHKPGRHLRAIQDMTFGLNENPFWVQNAGQIMPVFRVALNAHIDRINFLAEKDGRADFTVYDSQIIAGEQAPLEVFTAITYALGGASLMMSTSTVMKKELRRFFSKA